VVSDAVAIRVVDFLEIIDVHAQETVGVLIRGLFQRFRQHLTEIPPVVQAREVIPIGKGDQFVNISCRLHSSGSLALRGFWV